MAKAQLSPQAEEDMRNIWRYTADTWSETQAQTYTDALFDAMEALADDPGSGRPADEIRPGLRRQRCASHMIFYTRTGDGVLVARVLHQRMDFAPHLANDET